MTHVTTQLGSYLEHVTGDDLTPPHGRRRGTWENEPTYWEEA